MGELISMFCELDDFCKWFEPLYQQRLLQDGQRQRARQGQLSLSEIMAIIVFFHRSGCGYPGTLSSSRWVSCRWLSRRGGAISRDGLDPRLTQAPEVITQQVVTKRGVAPYDSFSRLRPSCHGRENGCQSTSAVPSASSVR